MIRANELMIGDWVLYGKKYAIVRRIETNRVTILVSINKRDELVEETYDNIDPIPLTPEILEKNEWEEKKEYDPYIYYLLNGKDYSVSLSKEWDSTIKTMYWSLSIGNHGTDANLSIDFIHELQHALRLCGIEKEITM